MRSPLHPLLLLLAALLTTTTPPSVAAIPKLDAVTCSPSRIALGSSANITWTLREDDRNSSRGVFSWQLYARNAVLNTTLDRGNAPEQVLDQDGNPVPVPINGPASTNLLQDPFVIGDFDWYQFGPHGIVDYTNQNLCLQTSLPYGPDVDPLGNPTGYSTQTFCPLNCKIVPPKRNYTYFTDLSFSPHRVRVGETIDIKWKYTKGFNFPKTVLLSIFFSSDYFEEFPQFIISDSAPAEPGSYLLKVDPALREFVVSNAHLVNNKFPYRLYMQLSFPPQTNPLGGLTAPGNLTVLSRRPCYTNKGTCRRDTQCEDNKAKIESPPVEPEMVEIV
ncbi:hypothetical protein DFJ77DRAFT_123681 [Powellomyces hirtus]|nr:hypothetical protein DFJ77DRAFT_123681 [Powellomyces hirtus]